MSVHKRTTKTRGTTYVVRWRDPIPREKTFERRVDAERFERKVRRSLDVGDYRDPQLDRVTIDDLQARWWPVAIDGRAPNTVAQYEVVVRLHVLPFLGSMRVSQVRQTDLMLWLALLRQEGRGDSTIRRARSLVSSIFTFAVADGIVAGSVASRLSLPAPAKRAKKALTASEVERFIPQFELHHQVLVLVLAYGGLRPGEALALRRRHFDPYRRTLLVEEGQSETDGRITVASTKTKSGRVVLLPQSVSEALEKHLLEFTDDDADALVFTTESGCRIHLSNFRRRSWRRARVAAGLPAWVTPYTMRHTAASLMAQQGVPPATAAAMLGNDPAVYLRTYTHLYPGDLGGAAAALEAARFGIDAPEEAGPARGFRGDDFGDPDQRSD